MTAPRTLTVLFALLVAPLLLPRPYLLAALADDAEEDDAAEASVEAGGRVPSEADVQGMADSARELKDKLGQLRELLASRDGEVDEDLKEKLKSLEASLGGLGLDADADPATDLVESCVAMSMRHSGLQRPSTIGALRRISQAGTALKDVADMSLMRLVAVCLNDLTEEQLRSHITGHLMSLPQAMVERSQRPEAGEAVLKIEPELWQELQTVAKAVLEQLATESGVEGLPIGYGLLAMIPLLLVVGFLAKKFKDMQKEQAAKKDKSKKKSK